jgi:hypothetical protein
VKPRSGQRLVESGPIRALARLDLGVFVDDLPIATVEVGFDGRALRLQAKAGLALPTGRNPIICAPR